MDYRQPLRIWEFFFGLLRAGNYKDKPVSVEGWYRRAPVPYIELKSFTPTNGTEKKCHVYTFKRIFSIVLIASGVAGIIAL